MVAHPTLDSVHAFQADTFSLVLSASFVNNSFLALNTCLASVFAIFGKYLQ